MTNILLDANVLLDLMLSRHKEADNVLKIIEQIETGRLNGFLTASVIHILAYWLSKEWGVRKARKGLLVLLEHFDLLDYDKRTAISALHSEMIDIEDALQYHTCLNHGLDAIISRDKEFVKAAIPGLPVLLPRDFVLKYIDA